jgi:hypothetical protein
MLGMLAVALLLVGMAIPQVTGGSQAPSATAPVPSTMQMTIVGMTLTASDGKIYVNEACRIFPGLVIPFASTEKLSSLADPVICHVEGASASEHREEKVVGSELDRSNVEVYEQEYVLQDVMMKPVVFVVLQRVPQGWRVDSDPQPTRMDQDVAVFEVHAAPGETVRLHVGERRTKELKPKVIH